MDGQNLTAAQIFLLMDAMGVTNEPLDRMGQDMSLKQADIEREMREDGHLWGEQEQWWNDIDQDSALQQQMMNEQQEREDDAYTGIE